MKLDTAAAAFPLSKGALVRVFGAIWSVDPE